MLGASSFTIAILLFEKGSLCEPGTVPASWLASKALGPTCKLLLSITQLQACAATAGFMWVIEI